VAVTGEHGRVVVKLDIVPDEDDPYATLSAWDGEGQQLAAVRVRPDFKLTSNTAQAWVDGGCRKP
jgi:hypothetical protein